MKSVKVSGYTCKRGVALNNARPASQQLKICQDNSRDRGVSCREEYKIWQGDDGKIWLITSRGKRRWTSPDTLIYRVSRSGWVFDKDYLIQRAQR